MLAGEPDERLVALARDGDERAFGAIVERYRAPLLQYCRGFLPPSAAEDALQQTFINAHAALTRGGGRAPVALKPWLYRVAHNAALNVARDPQAGLARLTEDIDGVERPDEALVRSERFQRVVGAVRALPVKQRQVIVRHALEGDSHEQIAADLGLSAGAIRQLAHRARRTVRDAAAVLFPGPLLRWLPWGANAAEAAAPAAGGAVVAKVAVAVVVAGAAGGGAVEVATHRADRESRRADAAVRSDVRERAGRAPQRVLARPVVTAAMPVRSGELVRGDGTRSDGKDSSRSRDDSSGPGSSNDDSSGSGSSGSGSSGSGSSGSGSSGSGSSGSGSSGSDSSGSGSSGSDSSGSGSSGSGSSGSGTSGSGSSGSGSSGSGSSGSGSSGSGSSGSGSSGSGSAPTTTLDSSGSGSSGSGTTTLESDSSGSGSGPSDEELEDDSSGSGSGHG